jgi:hypothetical protein
VKKKTFIFLIIVVIFLIVLLILLNYDNNSNEEVNIPHNLSIEEVKQCNFDNDCMQVKDNCCASPNCLYTSINQNYVEYWESRFDCTDVICAATACMEVFISECINNQCELVKVPSTQEILEIAKSSTSATMEGIPLNNIWDVVDEKVTSLGNGWYVNLTANYDFGCCSSCGPGQACATVCTSCGIKTIENNFIIDKNGVVINESFREIACTESESGWWRSRELKGENCFIEESEYVCPDYTELDCIPGIVPEIMWYCIEPYHIWIKDNCNVTFTY